MSHRHLWEHCNPADTQKIGASLSVPSAEEDRSRMLRGVRNALLLALPFWLGLIYWLAR